MSTCRSFTGFGVGPIPVWAIWLWADRHGLDEELTAHVETVIRLVDAETMRRQPAPSAKQ